MYKILALIPARGGSKGLPRKNIINLCGKPLIAYSIEQALASKYINRTIVSTDDEEIAEISLRYGAEVPFIRPSEFAQDLSTDIDVFYHALVWLRDNDGYVPDIVINHRAIFPIRKVELIDKAVEKFLSSDADSLRSVCVAKESPYKMWTLCDEYMKPVTNYPVQEFFNLPRQELPIAYWQIGYIDIIRSYVIFQRRMSGDKIIPFIIDEEFVDIDYEEDLVEAERLLKSGVKVIDKRHPT